MKFPLTMCLVPLLIAMPLQAATRLQPNDTLVIAGAKASYDGQYGALMADYFLMCQPTPGARILDLSWPSSEALSGLMPRLDSDILPFKPNVVILWFGQEDAAYQPFDGGRGAQFQEALTKAIDVIKAGGVRTILVGSPGVVDADAYQGNPAAAADYNKALAAYGDISRDVAKKEGVEFTDMHAVMMDVMTKAKAALGPKYVFSDASGRRTEQNSHLATAYGFLKALNCDGAIGTLTVDLDKKSADGTPGQKIVSFQDGLLTVESTRYPFCFLDNPQKPDTATSTVLRFVPFNDELNRYLLVVKGLKTARAKVTWGDQSKEFAAADLAKGVNLAAEFLQNPFVAPFAKVDQAVRNQEGAELGLVTDLMHNMKDTASYMPTQTATLSQLAAAAADQDRLNFAAAADLVVPVRHTLKIEPLSP